MAKIYDEDHQPPKCQCEDTGGQSCDEHGPWHGLCPGCGARSSSDDHGVTELPDRGEWFCAECGCCDACGEVGPRSEAALVDGAEVCWSCLVPHGWNLHRDDRGGLWASVDADAAGRSVSIFGASRGAIACWRVGEWGDPANVRMSVQGAPAAVASVAATVSVDATREWLLARLGEAGAVNDGLTAIGGRDG